MAEEVFRCAIDELVFRKLGAYDAVPVQSDYGARFVERSKAEDRFLVHSSESASFGHGLGCFLSGLSFFLFHFTFFFQT